MRWTSDLAPDKRVKCFWDLHEEHGRPGSFGGLWIPSTRRPLGFLEGSPGLAASLHLLSKPRVRHGVPCPPDAWRGLAALGQVTKRTR